MNLSEPYMKNAMVFVVKGDSTVAKMDDLKGKKIGVPGLADAATVVSKRSLSAEGRYNDQPHRYKCRSITAA